MDPLIVPERYRRYDAMIGVGGIGSGQFFAIHGNRTLSREESRGGRFLDRRDYCKLHIIAHYVGTLLGQSFVTIPVGKVGDDEIGKRLVKEIRDAGITTRLVQISPGEHTLSSICLIYPDGSGGNLTTDDSASSRVDADYVTRAEEDFRQHRNRGIALGVPEVPLAARSALIRLGSKYGFLRVASFTSDEIPEVIESAIIRELDLIALNRDEAAMISGTPVQATGDDLAAGVVKRLSCINPSLRVSVTAGSQGSWSWDGRSLRHVPAIPVTVKGTAGAGDAHLAGIIVGLVAGLELGEAQQFGTLLAALSVTSPHTICPGVGRSSILDLAVSSRTMLPSSVMAVLRGVDGVQ